MTLRDGVGTNYVMQPFDEIDGRGLFAFVPGVPPIRCNLVNLATGWSSQN